MQRAQLDHVTRGWFVGNFTPSTFWTKECEVGYLKHKKGEDWAAHYQQRATEINLLVRGSLNLQYYHYLSPNERRTFHFHEGDIFIIFPEEVVKPEFLTDCELVCVKIPSLPDDKVTL